MIVRFLVMLYLLHSMIIPSRAAEITPSHVYLKTEILKETLAQQGLLDTQRYESVIDDTALRHPRHVMQKVRQCDTVLTKLLTAQNIDIKPMPQPTSTREIKPADVMEGVDHLLAEASLLSPKPLPNAVFVAGKVPSDVYNNLKRICAAIRADIMPSDVFQIAQAVNNNLDQITKVRGYNFAVDYQQFQGKIPADVYQETWTFLSQLRQLALHPDLAIPGGVIVPNHVPERQIIPQDVMTLMNDALAETNAIKYALSLREALKLPPYQTGKTPSDVFAQIHRANNVLLFLIEKEAND